jgi:acetyltransferase-like isoleucine patch superfamily enzyme
MSFSPVIFIQRVCMGGASRFRNLSYRALGVRMKGYNWLRSIEIPYNHRNIELNSCSLDRGVVLLCGGAARPGVRLSIGDGTYINRRTFIDANESIIIGRNVAIGPNCYITDHDHGLDPSRPPLQQEMLAKPTRIEDAVWLGANVVVLKGVTIGARSVVGAGSVVTRSLPADIIAVGVPARVIRSRTPTDASPGVL